MIPLFYPLISGQIRNFTRYKVPGKPGLWLDVLLLFTAPPAYALVALTRFSFAPYVAKTAYVGGVTASQSSFRLDSKSFCASTARLMSSLKLL